MSFFGKFKTGSVSTCSLWSSSALLCYISILQLDIFTWSSQLLTTPCFHVDAWCFKYITDHEERPQRAATYGIRETFGPRCFKPGST